MTVKELKTLLNGKDDNADVAICFTTMEDDSLYGEIISFTENEDDVSECFMLNVEEREGEDEEFDDEDGYGEED